MPLALTEPWSKRHKQVTGSDLGAGRGLPFNSLSNSHAEPLSHAELVRLTLARGERALVDEFSDHSLRYTPNGGSADLREEISRLYGPTIGPDNVLVFAGAQSALQTAALALLDPSAHAIVFTPGTARLRCGQFRGNFLPMNITVPCRHDACRYAGILLDDRLS